MISLKLLLVVSVHRLSWELRIYVVMWVEFSLTTTSLLLSTTTVYNTNIKFYSANSLLTNAYIDMRLTSPKMDTYSNLKHHWWRGSDGFGKLCNSKEIVDEEECFIVIATSSDVLITDNQSLIENPKRSYNQLWKMFDQSQNNMMNKNISVLVDFKCSSYPPTTFFFS